MLLFSPLQAHLIIDDVLKTLHQEERFPATGAILGILELQVLDSSCP